jgi:hypothetical protein
MCISKSTPSKDSKTAEGHIKPNQNYFTKPKKKKKKTLTKLKFLLDSLHCTTAKATLSSITLNQQNLKSSTANAVIHRKKKL